MSNNIQSKKKYSKKTKGGASGASGWISQVYGTNQHRGADGSIAVNVDVAKAYKGGKKGGKGVITDVAVPAVLLYASTMAKPSAAKTMKKRRYRSKSYKNKK